MSIDDKRVFGPVTGGAIGPGFYPGCARKRRNVGASPTGFTKSRTSDAERPKAPDS